MPLRLHLMRPGLTSIMGDDVHLAEADCAVTGCALHCWRGAPQLRDSKMISRESHASPGPHGLICMSRMPPMPRLLE